MQELGITWGRVLSVWWLAAWRSIILGGAIGYIVGFVIGFLARIIGLDAETASVIVMAITVPGGIVWGIIVTRMMLRKRYKGFRLAIISDSN